MRGLGIGAWTGARAGAGAGGFICFRSWYFELLGNA